MRIHQQQSSLVEDYSIVSWVGPWISLDLIDPAHLSRRQCRFVAIPPPDRLGRGSTYSCPTRAAAVAEGT